MAFRTEGLRRYHANEFSVVAGPPARVFFPRVSLRPIPAAQFRLGPISVIGNPPIWHSAAALIEAARSPVAVVEIGPGNGSLAAHLSDRFGERIRGYYGIERDPAIKGPYERVESVAGVPEPIDVVIASEVAEHMTADEWFLKVLAPLKSRIAPTGSLCMSVPNPLSPGGILRDFTHVQAYPWYDLYAILRLSFEKVEVVRTFYAWSAQRLAFLLPRMLICPIVEMDWCDGITCVATNPIRDEG